jgi:GH15 family glucan-1,4-alpha-glucosidase
MCVHSNGPLKIEDYALIGDCQTAALVGRDGSIDWLCWPRFDSPACFAALLGKSEHGRWKIAPAEPIGITRRAYRRDTLILETEFETGQGAATLIDFMPVRNGQSHLVRIVAGRRGRVTMEMELVLRFDYGESVPWVTRLPEGNGVRAIAGPDLAVLHSPVRLEGRDLTTVARFEICDGDTLPFVLSYGPSHVEAPARISAPDALAHTERFWRKWAGRCKVDGAWAEPVRRSLITLKALTFAPTGGIVAAPTTSLPEKIGGIRNWDYRHCWLRDATLTLLALMGAGYYDEARDWREWLVRAVAGSPEQLQIMYGIGGERRLTEQEIGHLPGYEGSAPVRVGNAAAGQFQLDVYGEVLDALYEGCKGGLARYDSAWNLQCALLRHLEKVWVEPDAGMWEVRGVPRHFTYSKIMCWVAFDRAIRMVEGMGVPGPAARWRELRQRIHDDVCDQGVSRKRGCFVQSYGSEELDASLLLIPMTGFLPATDARVLATVDAIRRELSVDGLVQRYRTHESLDDLPPGEGVFLACSFWLVDNLRMQGRLEEARALFARLVSLANDVGLLAEEYDPIARRHLGNFPQAFSHVAMINSAMNLCENAQPAEQRAEPARAT